jgi:hypothetical protein
MTSQPYAEYEHNQFRLRLYHRHAHRAAPAVKSRNVLKDEFLHRQAVTFAQALAGKQQKVDVKMNQNPGGLIQAIKVLHSR